jgi:hypothetical protein
MKIKSLIVGLLLIATVFNACKKDEPAVLSKEEAKAVLSDFSSKADAQIAEMDNLPAMQALNFLVDSDLPFFGINKKSAIQILGVNQMMQYLHLNKLRSLKKSELPVPSVEFTESVGTYTWNHETKEFDYQHGTPANQIVILYPFAESATNNAKFVLTEYTEKTIHTTEGDQTVLAKMAFELYIDNVKKANCVLTADATDKDGVTGMAMTLNMDPYSITMGMGLVNSAIKLDMAIKSGGTSLVSTSITVKTVDTVVEGEEESEPTAINGFFQYGKLQINFNADLTKYGDDSVTAAQMNQAFQINLITYPEGDIVGAIKFVDTEDGPTPMIAYNDGTMEPIDDFFGTMEARLFDIILILVSYGIPIPF